MNVKITSLMIGALALSIGALGCSKGGQNTAPSAKPANSAASQPSAKPTSQPAGQPASQPAAKTSSTSTTASGPIRRGAKFTVNNETALADVLAKPADFEGKTVKIRGEVARCCLKKGCWMELTSAGLEQGVRVRFKDYAFFVPLDSAGSKALVEGQINTRTLDEDTAKHLEDEGAKIFRNAEGMAIELALVATAVELNR